MNNEAINQTLNTYLSENPWIIFLIIWIIFWKGLALWRASQEKQKIWFVALLVVNTLGLLEIIYLLIVKFRSHPKIINPIAPDHFEPPKNPNLS